MCVFGILLIMPDSRFCSLCLSHNTEMFQIKISNNCINELMHVLACSSLMLHNADELNPNKRLTCSMQVNLLLGLLFVILGILFLSDGMRWSDKELIFAEQYGYS